MDGLRVLLYVMCWFELVGVYSARTRRASHQTSLEVCRLVSCSQWDVNYQDAEPFTPTM